MGPLPDWAMFLPMQGITDLHVMWYPSIKEELEKYCPKVIFEPLPNPSKGLFSEWMPFLEERMKGSKQGVLVGHSRGAVAAMRYAEKHPLRMLVVVAPHYTDLNDPSEKASGFYDAPWNWPLIKKNCPSIVMVYSRDDPFVSLEESRTIRDALGAAYYEESEGHFTRPDRTIMPSLQESFHRVFQGF
ncbi:MAG: alpha/beta hydrolase, partial [archaeon]